MRILIAHNPASGPRSDEIYAFERALIRPGDEVVMRALGDGATTESQVRDAASFDAVVASGGDGTVADVAYAIRGTGVPMLVFPSGTANLLANNIDNAFDPPALAATLREGKRVRLDMCELEYSDGDGSVQKRGFLTMAGAGYDASIMQGSAALKAMFGQLSYYLAALGNLDPGTSHFKIAVDGEQIEADGICVLVANWAHVTQALEFIPGSSPTDGLLDVAILTVRNSVELLPAAIGSVFSHGNEAAYPNVSFRHARSIEVECDPALPMQYDGEVVDGAHSFFAARVIPGGLTTMVDANSPLA